MKTEYEQIRNHIIDNGASLVEAAEGARLGILIQEGHVELAGHLKALLEHAQRIDELLELDPDHLAYSLRGPW